MQTNKCHFTRSNLNFFSINKFLRTKRFGENMNINRGALIVFEGCDRAGKSTLSKKLVNYLNANGHDTVYMNFPCRDTDSGDLIDAYLKNACQMCDEGIHLLFTFNRWEATSKMLKLLEAGKTIIVDRYAYSGVAYSVAKGLSLEWCQAPETGLLKPDAVIFLNLSVEEMKARGGFGDERYEKVDFQKRVLNVYEKLKDESYWININANKTPEELLEETSVHVTRLIEESKTKPLQKLW